MTDALLTCLTEEQQTANRFAVLLAEEQAALMTGNLGDVLPAIVERKAALATQLAELSVERGRCLGLLGFSNDRQGMLAAIATDARLAPIWEELAKNAASARSRNLTNGMLVRTRMEYNQRAIAVLREAGSTGASTPVYGPDGRISVYSR
jgi:flagella synthesis protein FlgN